MESPAAPKETPEYPSANSACETCKKPDMSNMTWEDGVKHFFSTFFAAPRMWPLGYIMDSPYSPLRVECHMPSRNWRDAFEDLLALEAGGPMIREESRKAEDQFSARTRFELASFAISQCNYLLDDNWKSEARYRKAHQVAVKNKDHESVATISKDLIPFVKSQNEELITSAQRAKADFEKYQDWTASSLKPRGQWIASLMDSGALPTWKWQVYNSTDGPVMDFGKRNAPPDMAASITVSELELHEIFEEGQPHGFGSPARLPSMAMQALVDGSHTPSYLDLPIDPLKNFRPSKSSILAQIADTEIVKMPGGSNGTKVKIQNILADGTREMKEFVQDPGKLLEEIESARSSMLMMRSAVHRMFQGPPEPLKRAGKVVLGGGEDESMQLPED